MPIACWKNWVSMRFKVVRLCKTNALSIVPQEVVRFDLEASAAILKEQGYNVEDSGVMIVAGKSGIDITIYQNGRMMIHPATEKERAREIAAELYSIMNSAIRS